MSIRNYSLTGAFAGLLLIALAPVLIPLAILAGAGTAMSTSAGKENFRKQPIAHIIIAGYWAVVALGIGWILVSMMWHL